MPERGKEQDKTVLRNGFTTGSCAAAASKAAAEMLLFGESIHHVTIQTPKGIPWTTEVLQIERQEDAVSCAVRKFSGDDPDVTNGTLIAAHVRKTGIPGIRILGGEGVGRVTRPGLDQPVGESAINSVPRRMIRESLEPILAHFGNTGRPDEAGGNVGLEVTIEVPEGRVLAEKTFNPRLGIVGGISILGTTGIVEPMSDRAILETIRTEISVRAAEGQRILAVVPGNYGMEFMKTVYRIPETVPVFCSNFVCDTVCYAAEAGFERLLLAGHLGKLVKVAGGIKNTHSRYGDRRMEILTEIAEACAGLSEAEMDELRARLGECVMTDEAVRILRKCHPNGAAVESAVSHELVRRIKSCLEEWSGQRLRAEVIVFSSKYGELAASDQAEIFLSEFCQGLEKSFDERHR